MERANKIETFGCKNCGRDNRRNWDHQGFCKHENTARIFRLEKAEACPLWSPPISICNFFFSIEVHRKGEIYKNVCT